ERICLGLQRLDSEKVLHGRKTGIIKRLPHGEFIEVHEPISADERYVLTAHEMREPLVLPPSADANGIPHPDGRKARMRAKLSRWYFGDDIAKPTAEEYKEVPSGH